MNKTASLTQSVLFGHPLHAQGVVHVHSMDKPATIKPGPAKPARDKSTPYKKPLSARALSRATEAIAKGCATVKEIRSMTGMDMKSIRASVAKLKQDNVIAVTRVGRKFFFRMAGARNGQDSINQA